MQQHSFSIGVIGLGGVAEAHLCAYEELVHVNIAAICDIREDAAQKAAHKTGARAYASHRELLAKEKIDLALVLTPASTHRDIVEACAETKTHVLCEKPLAVTIEDGEAMVAACEVAGVNLFYGSCYRYLPAIAKAKLMIDEGLLGDILLMTESVTDGQGLAGYRELPPAHYPIGGPGGPGMGIVDHGVHLIDIFSWLADANIRDVYGQGQISGAPPIAETMTMKFDNGALGQLTYCAATYSTTLPHEGAFSGGRGWMPDGSFADTGLWQHDPGSISVYGTNGSLRIFHYANALYLKSEAGVQQIPLSGRPAFGHFATQLETCLADIANDRAPVVSGQRGLDVLRTMWRLYEKQGLKPATSD